MQYSLYWFDHADLKEFVEMVIAYAICATWLLLEVIYINKLFTCPSKKAIDYRSLNVAHNYPMEDLASKHVDLW